jgi:hypothetical protein
LDRHSVHSRVITSRTPLFFAMEGRCAAKAKREDNRPPYLVTFPPIPWDEGEGAKGVPLRQ